MCFLSQYLCFYFAVFVFSKRGHYYIINNNNYIYPEINSLRRSSDIEIYFFDFFDRGEYKSSSFLKTALTASDGPVIGFFI